MRKFILISILFCLPMLFTIAQEQQLPMLAAKSDAQTPSRKDSLRYTLSYSAGFNAGYIMPDGKVDVYPKDRPVLGGKIGIEIRPTRPPQGLRDWNNASVGVAVDYLNLGNDKWLGNLIAPYTYLNVPIVRTPHFRFGIRPGIGLAFTSKTYYNTIPQDLENKVLYKYGNDIIANQCAGSVTNFYFAEALYLEFPISNGFSIMATGGWYHASNGSTIQPNSGYNMFNAEIGVRYTPEETQREEEKVYADRIVPPALPLYEGKRWDVEISASGGFRQCYYYDKQYSNATVGVASVSIAAHYRPWAIFKIGGGIDMFYDGYYRSVSDEFMPLAQAETENIPLTHFKKTYLAQSDIKNCFRVGISLQPEFVVGRFTTGFHFGVYLFDPVKNLEPYNEAKKSASGTPPLSTQKKSIFYSYDLGSIGTKADGWFYTRILLKYRVTDYIFVQLGMKAHLTKVEFIDAGLGVQL